MKKIAAIIIAMATFTNMCVHAQLVDNNGVYTEDFEVYTSGSEILTDSTLFSGVTQKEPDLATVGGSQVMAVKSDAGKDNMVLTNPVTLSKDITTLNFKIGAAGAPNKNWNAGSSVIFRYTNEYNEIMDICLYDFAYGFIRNKVNGAEKVVVNYVAPTMYDATVKMTRAERNGSHYIDLYYKVGDKGYNLSYKTIDNGEMSVVFKSGDANALYVDDVSLTVVKYVRASLKESGRTDIAVNSGFTLEFDDAIDTDTMIEPNVYIGNNQAGLIEALGDNRYMIYPMETLQKNTEYTFRLGFITDLKGQEIKNTNFKFKTKNTSVVIDADKIINTSQTDGENIISVNAQYADNKMSNEVVSAALLEAGDDIDIDSNKDYIVLTDDYRPIDTEVFCENTGLKNDDFTVDFNETTQEIIISGKTVASMADEYVAISVFDRNGDLDYVNIVKTNENGYFSTVVVPSSSSGLYTINAKTLNESFSDTENVRSVSDSNSMLAIVNSENVTAAQINEALATYDIMLGIALPEYTSMTDKTDISNGIIANIADEGKYLLIDDLVDDIKAISVICAMKASETPNTVFSANSSLLISAEDTAYARWNNAGEDLRDKALERALSQDIASPYRFNNQLYAQMLLTEIENTNKYGDVKTIIETYPDVLGLDLTAYNSAGKPTSVAKGLYGAYRNKPIFIQEFNRLVTSAAATPRPQSGGGGGGTGSSISSNIPLPSTNQTPVPTSTPNPQTDIFNDLQSCAWAKDAIYALYNMGIVSGYDDNSFRPNNNVTREEFVTMVVNYMGINENASCSFADVNENAWYYPYVAKAYASGLISGIGENKFGIGMNITRQDAVVVLARIDDSSYTDNGINYTDAELIADYAVEAVKKLTAQGIISGNPDGSFNPNGFLTRAEAAQMIYSISLVK